MAVRIRDLFARRRTARHAQTEPSRDIETWLDELRGDPQAKREAKAAVDRAIQVYTAVLEQLSAAGCSCTGPRVVVIHDRGTGCGEIQHDLLWHAVESGHHPNEVLDQVLDVLRGDHR